MTLYKFVKGQGWILDRTETFEFTDAVGKRWRVEKRLARKGELWDATPQELLPYRAKLRGKFTRIECCKTTY